MGDWDQEWNADWLAQGSPIYQEGAGYVDPSTGQLSNMVPQQTVTPAAKDTSMWNNAIGANKGFKYTPQQLGWSAAESARFAEAGIDKLPEWFNKPTVYSGEFHLGNNDPVSSFISLYNTPMDEATDQWSGAKKAYNFLTGSGGDPEDPAFKEAYLRSAFGMINNARDSWWDRNEGWEMGGGGILTIGLGGLAAEAGLLGEAAVAGVEGGAATGTGVGGTAVEAGGGWLGALEGGMGAYGPTGAGASGSLGSLGISGTGSLGTLGGDVMGFNNATPLATAGTGGASTSGSGIAEAIAAGQAGGADVGMGAGTSIFTDMGLPASYGSGLGDAASYFLGSGSGSSSIWDSITNLLSPSGGNTSTGGTNWASLLGPLLGVGGAVAGGVLGNNAIQDSIKEMQKYYKPFYDLGVSNIPALNAADPTGGSGQYIDQLKDYGTNFEFDYANPAYTQQLAETTRINDQNLASRGMYNSRAALNLQDQSARNLVTTEYDKQYARGYGNLTDLFNMTNQNAGTNYGKLLDMVKIGSGASSSAGQGSLAAGQSSANLYAGLGAMPMNYAILSKLLGGK